MPKRTNAFQQLVARVYTQLAPEGARVTESALVKERDSEAVREVDILIEHEIIGHRVRMAIECRDRKDKDDIEWIDGLIGKYRDLAVDKVIAVSGAGFTKLAASKALANHIETLTLKEAGNVSWPDEFTRLVLFQIQRVDHLDKVDAIFDPPIALSLSPDTALYSDDGTELGGIKAFLQSYFETAIPPLITDHLNHNWREYFKSDLDFQQGFYCCVGTEFNKPCRLFVGDVAYQLVKATFWVRSEFAMEEKPTRHFLYNEMMVTTGTLKFGDAESVLQVVQAPAVRSNQPQAG